MNSQSVAMMNSPGQLAFPRHDVKAVSLIERSASIFKTYDRTSSNAYYAGRDEATENKNMSVDFREVFKEFNTKDKNGLIRKDKISNAFHFGLGENLLLSNGNMRPKSRSKTSINSNDFQKLPCDSEWKLIHSTSAKLIRHKEEVSDIKNHADVLSPSSAKDIKNDINSNAQEAVETSTEAFKKGKRARKRNASNTKNKKGKHGRVLTAATGIHEKRSSVQQILTNTQHVKASRISSEPPSKLSQACIMPYTLQNSGNGFAQKQTYNIPFANKNMHDLYPLRVTSAKTNSSTLPSTHYMHDNLTCNPVVNNLTSVNSLESQGQSVVIYKVEMKPRVKSASSLKSDLTSKHSIQTTEADTFNTEEISINAVSCNLQLSSKSIKPVIKYQQKSLNSTQGLSTDFSSKESELTSIYGAVYHTADKVSAQAEELKKVKKIFLSEKQSGTIRESGMEFPCAPPATPTPDLLRKHEYVPSMSDIRSQRAVKSRLQVIEKEALKKQEKRKEATAKLEKQQQKDKEKQVKTKQRREIYALNKIMTELENKRFVEFCQAKGLNKL